MHPDLKDAISKMSQNDPAWKQLLPIHVRSAHLVELNQHGHIVPHQRLSYAEAAALERRGFEVLRQDLSPTWGEFGTLAVCDGRYYLLALA